MMLGLNPFDGLGQGLFSPQQRPRQASSVGSLHPRKSSSASEPSELRLQEFADAYRVSIDAPNCDLDDLHPTVDESGILVVTGAQAGPSTVEYVVDWHRGVRVRAQPSLRASVLGYLQPGERLLGSPPEDGWVRLNDGQGWVLLDGSSLGLPTLLRPLRRSPARAVPFVRKLRLPHDAAVDAAAARHHGHTLTITLPKLAPRKKPAAPVRPTAPLAATKRPAAAPVAAPAAASSAAAASASAKRAKSPPTAPASARAAASHKRTPAASPMDVDAPTAAASRRRPASARPAVPLVPGLSTSDPLLSEAAPSTANVQSPAEKCEEWRAMACGGFAPASAPMKPCEEEQRRRREKTEGASPSRSDDFSMF